MGNASTERETEHEKQVIDELCTLLWKDVGRAQGEGLVLDEWLIRGLARGYLSAAFWHGLRQAEQEQSHEAYLSHS